MTIQSTFLVLGIALGALFRAPAQESSVIAFKEATSKEIAAPNTSSKDESSNSRPVVSITNVIPQPTGGQSDKEGASAATGVIDAASKLLGSIAWPIAAIVIAFRFHEELAALLERLKKGKIGNTELEFAAYVADADSEIPRDPEAERLSPSAVAQATGEPRTAILSAWLDIEYELNRIVIEKNLLGPETRAPKATFAAIRALQKEQLLDPAYIALLQDLRGMRNQATHSVDFAPPTAAVLRYVQLAADLLVQLRKIR